MSCLFVIWLGDRPIEKLFTSLRICLWLNIFNKLSNETKHLFLLMFDEETNRNFIDIVIHKLHLLENQQIYFLNKLESNPFDDEEFVKSQSNLISFDKDHRLVVNIEHVDSDYLLKSSKDTSSIDLVRVPDEYRLFEKLNSLGKLVENMRDTRIIHLCDFQSQYQCELFVILSNIFYPNLKHVGFSFEFFCIK